MKKTINLLRNLTVLVLLTATILTTNAQKIGDKFIFNDIKYEVTSLAPNKVQVTNKYPFPTGNIIIPAEVNYQEQKFAVTMIGNNAFTRCKSLTSITIPNSVISIGRAAFYDCESLNFVTIGNSVENIVYNAFGNCKSLTSITLPNSVKGIESGVFYGCESLISITIGNSVEWIGGNAFKLCKSLTSIEVDKENPKYCSKNGILFSKDKTGLIHYPIRKKEKKYTIPNSVEIIEEECFGYSNLTSITIPNSIKNIKSGAFNNCLSLISIFSKIKNINGVKMINEIFKEVNKDKCILFVPKGKIGEYRNAKQWKEFKNIKEDNTAVHNITLTNPILVVGNNITVSGVAGKEVKLYSLSGQVLYNLHTTQENITLSVKQIGTYILQVGNATRKVVVN